VAGVIATNGAGHVSTSVPDSGLHQPSTAAAVADTEVDNESVFAANGATHGPGEGDSSAAADVGLTIGHAAALLGVHPNTLRKRIRKGTLPAMLVDGPTGREYRIAAVDVRALQTDAKSSPPSQAPATVEGDSAPSTVVATVPDTPTPPASTESDSDGDSPVEVRRLEEMVELLRDELELRRRELREEQEARRREIQQLHTLLAQAQQLALPPPASPEIHQESQAGPRDAEPEREAVRQQRRPWWRFW